MQLAVLFMLAQYVPQPEPHWQPQVNMSVHAGELPGGHAIAEVAHKVMSHRHMHAGLHMVPSGQVPHVQPEDELVGDIPPIPLALEPPPLELPGLHMQLPPGPVQSPPNAHWVLQKAELH